MIIDWGEVTALLDSLYTSSSRLEEIFPGRKFTLDGHLVGSVGEVVAAYMFELDLNPASTLGHDAIAQDGRRVEIKLTQGKSIAIRHEPDHMIALCRPKGGPVRVVYNGPGNDVWAAAGARSSNGQRPISIAKLVMIDGAVSPDKRLPLIRHAPI